MVYGGTPEVAIELALECCEIVASDMLVTEVISKLKLKTDAPYRWLNPIKSNIEKVCKIVDIGEPPNVVRDPKDNHIIAAAVQGRCEYIVTGDNDLLDLGSLGPITMISPSDFIAFMKIDQLGFTMFS